MYMRVPALMVLLKVSGAAKEMSAPVLLRQTLWIRFMYGHIPANEALVSRSVSRLPTSLTVKALAFS